MSATIQHGKLHHQTPGWVPQGARFHIRVRTEGAQRALTDTSLCASLLDSVRFYHARQRWYAWIFLLMPDHLHAILSFPAEFSMSRVMGDWKRFHERENGVLWQDGFFDHRLRNEDEFAQKCQYIRMNPVRKELCKSAGNWPAVCEPWRNETQA